MGQGCHGTAGQAGSTVCLASPGCTTWGVERTDVRGVIEGSGALRVPRAPRAAFVPCLIAAIGIVSACSSAATDQGTPASPPASPSLMGGMAACDEAALADTAEGAIAPDEKVESIDAFGCADGWAYAFVSVGPADGSGTGGYTMTMIFEAEGQFWVPKDAMDVCGSASTGSSQPVAPGDSLVPASIWQDACWSN